MKANRIDQEEDGRGELVVEVDLRLDQADRPAVAVFLCLIATLQQLVNEGRMTAEDMADIMDETVRRSEAALEAGYVDVVMKIIGGKDGKEVRP